MFNDLFHPYLRWLRGRSQGGRPDFNIDRDGLPPQTLVQHTLNFATPESDVLLPSAPPPTGLAGFVVEQPNEVPGFRVGLRDDVPGFTLNENDVPPPESPWPAGIETAAPEFPSTAEMTAVPPGVEEPDQPTPQSPEWLRNVLTMPVPRLSTAFDPQTGRRIVPYEPLINWTRPYPTVDQNVRGTGIAAADGPEIEASLEAPAIKQWAPPAPPERLADINTRPDPARPIVQEPKWTSWPQPLEDGQPDVHSSGINPEDPWRSVVQPRQQQTPFPQGQRTRLSNVPETAFGKDPVGIQPTPLKDASPIELSVYNPDIDPGYDDLFDLVQGVGENRIQGNAARDAEAERIKKAYPNAPFAQEIRLYAEGVPGHMTVDIMFRPNGTSMIMIFEVKSGNATLSPQQVATLAEAVRTGKVYLVNPDAAKKFELRPGETFASKGIIPFVYVTGGNQDAIVRQLNKLGVEAIPEKTRRGQVPRLRIGAPPT
jgi:hypothetical protein